MLPLFSFHFLEEIFFFAYKNAETFEYVIKRWWHKIKFISGYLSHSDYKKKFVYIKNFAQNLTKFNYDSLLCKIVLLSLTLLDNIARLGNST
jgi:hypothetical protein